MVAAKKYSFLEAKAKIESWCAYQERSPYETEKKLYELGLDAEDTSVLLAALISTNFLNEERFAQAFCSGKFRIKKWGKLKIVQHLKQHRISSYSIQKGLEEIDDADYFLSIESLIERKTDELKKEKNTWTKRAKIIRFLQSRGYEMEYIQERMKSN